MPWSDFDRHLSVCPVCREYVFTSLEAQVGMMQLRKRGLVVESSAPLRSVLYAVERKSFRWTAMMFGVVSTLLDIYVVKTTLGSVKNGASLLGAALVALLVLASLFWFGFYVQRFAVLARSILRLGLALIAILLVATYVSGEFLSLNLLVETVALSMSYIGSDLLVRSMSQSQSKAVTKEIVRVVSESPITRWRYRVAMALVVLAPILITSSIAKVEASSAYSHHSLVAVTASKTVAALPCSPLERKVDATFKVTL
ncbi:hypothetical protein SAMN02745225_00217 [Ferrithrix thermotolerans DSM 19514]|uniref:Uncharacterized protein n=2 Tax=Ferrithrix TaxID=643949 RepID=A0A1M4SD39_9ACTN|nr:hypothetical protein SAMN02745225_00217 [Ferrithrix thermotolerans DSM 19514]